MVKDIIEKISHSQPDRAEIVELLSSTGDDLKLLFEDAQKVRLKYIGNKVYLRGLIEYSNRCLKDCFYCGVRRGNSHVHRYTVEDKYVIEAAQYAFDNNFASLVLQSGERSNPAFTSKISYLLEEIKKLSGGKLGVTLSMGEQSEEVYNEWFNAGAHRFLLRIEASNRSLYSKMHPNDELHSFDRRIDAIKLLRKCGYQVGTGVMVGLPFQTLDDLAKDLLFMQELDIDMCGMGPYIEHEETPLYEHRALLMPLQDRFELSLKMVAILRLLMKDVNIAATTAMQTIDSRGREKAISVGANVVMPNLTPLQYREDYFLYNNKPGVADDADSGLEVMRQNIEAAGSVIGFGEWGDSKHFKKRKGIK